VLPKIIRRLEGDYCTKVIIGIRMTLKTNLEKTVFLYTDEKVEHNLYSLIVWLVMFPIGVFKIFKKPLNS
jgi:hypothetical protein